MAELKSCPFCGEKAVVEMDEGWYWEWNVYCSECGIHFPNHFETKEEAIEAWNRRVDNEQVQL